MALEKNISLGSGVVASYSKINSVQLVEQIDGESKTYQMTVSVLLYLDQDKRNENANPLLQKTYTLGTNLTGMESANPFAYGYALLKTLQEYAGYQDV